MSGQVLHILQRHVLGEQVGHHQDAEAVGAEDRGQPGILQSPFEHEAHGVGRQGPGGELLLLAQGRSEQWGLLGICLDPGRRQVLPEPAVEVVADGDLALLAALFPKAQDALGSLVLEVPSPQPGDGADPGPGVGEGSEQGPIAEAHDVGSVDRVEQVPGLLDGKAGGLAVRGVVLAAADRLEGIQGRGVTGDEGVEEMPQAGQGLVFGRAVAGALEDSRDRSGGIQGSRGGPQGGLGRGAVDWELGPLQSFKDRWADPKFENRATAFLQQFVGTDDKPIKNPALLCKKGNKLDGQQPSEEERRALELSLAFAFIDRNPRFLSENCHEAWGRVTADNAEFYLWPIDLEQGRVTTNTGYIVLVRTGGYQISDTKLVLRPPLDLHMPLIALSPDPLVLAGIYETVLVSLRYPDADPTAQSSSGCC